MFCPFLYPQGLGQARGVLRVQQLSAEGKGIGACKHLTQPGTHRILYKQGLGGKMGMGADLGLEELRSRDSWMSWGEGQALFEPAGGSSWAAVPWPS